MVVCPDPLLPLLQVPKKNSWRFSSGSAHFWMFWSFPHDKCSRYKKWAFFFRFIEENQVFLFNFGLVCRIFSCPRQFRGGGGPPPSMSMLGGVRPSPSGLPIHPCNCPFEPCFPLLFVVLAASLAAVCRLLANQAKFSLIQNHPIAWPVSKYESRFWNGCWDESPFPFNPVGNSYQFKGQKKTPILQNNQIKLWQVFVCFFVFVWFWSGLFTQWRTWTLWTLSLLPCGCHGKWCKVK